LTQLWVTAPIKVQDGRRYFRLLFLHCCGQARHRVHQGQREAVAAVADAAFALGLGCLGVVASPLPGPSGNVEYFLWLAKAGQALLEVDLDLAIEKGPA